MTSEMDRLIHSRHRKAARYAVQNLSSVLGTVHTVSLAMSLVLVGVAVLTLITAGTGIMNIMFVNVAQRTHEIGIRKALGARTAEIRLQFVLEAAFISLSGAIIGVVIALGMIWSAFRLIEGAVPLSVSWIAVFFAPAAFHRSRSALRISPGKCRSTVESGGCVESGLRIADRA